ncbi:isatin hydrolase-like [Eriocheir sinensis]|uniref:isatin hydrolase-like n=1 Tax=Eriocheir sinensis TaxID=95602 RepID=UPI0021CADB5B|nr:isatin hydrolase-like [Eriocheir sinensis]
MLIAAPLLLALLVGVCECSTVTYIDLGHAVDENSMHWVNLKPFTREVLHRGYFEHGDYWLESYSFCTPEHLSTHLDAPSHYAEGKWSVADIPLERLIGKGVVVDIRHKVRDDPTAELMADDLMAWMDEYGPLPDGAVVFVLTGWGQRYGNKTAYYGNDNNNSTNLIFPGINPGAAQLLAGYEHASGRRVFGVGIDTASLDHGPSKTFKTHIDLSKENIYGLENVANLEKLPTKDFEVIVMPIKLTGGSGGPTRLVARIPALYSAAMAFYRPASHYLLLLLATFTILILL